MSSGLPARVAATGLLAPGRPVLVLVSGGRDSTCLLDLAVELCGAAAVRALHVDFGLRPGSGDDALACLDLGARLGVEVAVERAGAPPAAGNVQAWARELRYARARELAGPDGDVAAGHTATDQVETVLYRLASSPGRRALLGMEARAGRLVRPLLGVTREETGEWCRARGLPWRDDPTNAGGRYARGRVRHGLVEALRAVDPRAEANVLRTAALLREEAAVLDGLVDDVLAPGGGDAVERARLAALPGALGRLVLRRLAEDATGALCGRAPGRLPEVLALPDPGALDLGDGARAEVRRGVLRCVRTP